MNGWALNPSAQGFEIIRVDGLEARRQAITLDKAFAERVVTLLNRHGLEDAPLVDMEES